MHIRSRFVWAVAAAAQLTHCLTSSCEGVWKDLAPITVTTRQEHTTVALSSSKIGIIGGVVPNGTASFTTTDLVQFYDIPSNTWHAPVAPLPVRLNHPNAAVVKGKLYLFGGLAEIGFGTLGAIPDSWVYDAHTNAWKSIAPVPAGLARGSAAIAVHGSTVILAGGIQVLQLVPPSAQETIDSVIAFDTASGKWISLPEAASHLPAARDHAGFAVVDKTLYVIGGRDRGQKNIRDTVFALNLRDLASGWTTKSNLPTARAGLAAAAVGKIIYTFGGEGNPNQASGVFNETEAYDTETDTWEKLSAMKFPRHGTVAVSVGGGIFLPGGGKTTGASAVDAFDAFYP